MRSVVTLPWPGPALSPNARPGHWGQRKRAVENYRHAAAVLTLEQIDHRRRRLLATGAAIMVDLEFVPPKNHKYDLDNLFGRMKAGLDGIAQALGVDDCVFRVGEVSLLGAVAQHAGEVKVTLTPRDRDITIEHDDGKTTRMHIRP
jgi:crossover junction endodeoxyribonuclease RusA